MASEAADVVIEISSSSESESVCVGEYHTERAHRRRATADVQLKVQVAITPYVYRSWVNDGEPVAEPGSCTGLQIRRWMNAYMPRGLQVYMMEIQEGTQNKVGSIFEDDHLLRDVAKWGEIGEVTLLVKCCDEY